MFLQEEINQKNFHGKTMAHIATEKGKIEILQSLFQLGANFHLKDDKNGYNCLHIAAKYGHTECLSFLLSLGININSTDNNGWSAFHHAISAGFLPIIKILHKNGADVHLLDKMKCNGVLIASEFGHVHCLKFLVKINVNYHLKTHFTNQSCFQLAAKNSHFKCVKYIGNSLPDLDFQYCDKYGDNALNLFLKTEFNATSKKKIFQQQRKRKKFIIYLLSLGININSRNYSERTPIFDSISNEIDIKKDILTLIEEGSHLNIIDKYGWTILHFSSFCGEKILKFLYLLFLEYDQTNQFPSYFIHLNDQMNKMNIKKENYQIKKLNEINYWKNRFYYYGIKKQPDIIHFKDNLNRSIYDLDFIEYLRNSDVSDLTIDFLINLRCDLSID